MIKMITDSQGREMAAIATPNIWSLNEVRGLRDALAEVIEICISYEEAKATADHDSLFVLSSLCRELTKDIEECLKKGGKV